MGVRVQIYVHAGDVPITETADDIAFLNESSYGKLYEKDSYDGESILYVWPENVLAVKVEGDGS